MSISLYKSSKRLQDIKWIPIMPEPTNASLVDAVLPDDLITLIVQEAAQDTPTALSLALVSKAVGRISEFILYKFITLHSLAAARTFTSTLRTKRRPILAGVTALTLLHPAPRDYEDFWSLLAQRCPHITHLSLSSADLDSAARTTLRPHHLTLLSPECSAVLPPQTIADLGFWSHVSHLHLPHYPPHALLPLLSAPTNIDTDTGSFVPRLTHVSCCIGYDHVAQTEVSYETLRLLLELKRAPALRVCIVVGGFQRGNIWADMIFPWMHNDNRRLVVLYTDDVEKLDGEGPYWEFAEQTIAERR